MSFKVLNPKPLAETAEKILRDAGIEVIRGSGPSKEALLKDIVDVDAFVVWKSPNYTVDKEVIDAGKNLKLISRFGVGMEMVDVDYALSKGIIVCNTPTSNSNAVAEHTLFFMMSLAKNFRTVNQRIRGGEFNTIWKLSAVELDSSTLGIIGIGRIGTMVAKKAMALGMKVLAYDPYPAAKIPEGVERVETLDELLESSDFVTIHVPETKETIGMIGTEQLKKMKHTAFLINCARGPIVQEAALVNALKNNVIKGAALDVFEKEPLPSDSPLRDLGNLLLTPHYAAFTDGAVRRTGIDVAESLIAVSKGKNPKYKIKK
jgi:D-3-phosphoglycerate dehydrogenase